MKLIHESKSEQIPPKLYKGLFILLKTSSVKFFPLRSISFPLFEVNITHIGRHFII